MTTRRDPFDEMNRMLEQMRNAMTTTGDVGSIGLEAESPMGRGSIRASGDGANLTMESTDDGYLVVADVPGFEKDEIELRLDGDSLVIVAERDVSEDRDGTISRRRRSVHERISVPSAVVDSEVTATYRNGVLEIRLPTDDEMDDDAGRIDID